MSNTITIELSAEDRARLDRLAEAMERRSCDKCVTSAMQFCTEKTVPVQEETTDQEVTQTTENEKSIDRAELRAKVIELSAKGLKAQTRDVVQAYAPTVASVPEEKITECYNKLVALEG